MRAILPAALAVAVSLCAAGCTTTAAEDSAAAGPAAGGVGMTLRDYQVIWTRGGKLGYLRTYDVAGPNETPVQIHYVLDLDLKRERGWVSDNGLGERYDYPESKIREALRTSFERVALPADSVVNQIKRICRVDPATEIALRPASASDVGQ